MKKKKLLGKKKKEKIAPAESSHNSDTMIVCGEMIEDRGEDYYIASRSGSRGIIGVFDGCGGSGARRYEEYGDQTGAYISSRSAAAAVNRWFDKFCAEDCILSKNTLEDICISIENRIFAALKKINSRVKSRSLKGSILKDFPTTASMICYTRGEDSLYSAFLWCGDSRGYVLQEQGLVQVTRDDIGEGLDALSNLKNDGRLTNVISADGNFILHGTIIECRKPALLITATDGSFGYFSSPMEFEYMLLLTLAMSSDAEEWCAQIDELLHRIAGDDYTIGIYMYGFTDFSEVKSYFARREEALYSRYLLKWDQADDKERKELWDSYKTVYYGEVR